MIAPADVAKGGTISTHRPLLLLPYRPRPAATRRRRRRQQHRHQQPPPKPSSSPSGRTVLDRIGVDFCKSCGRAVAVAAAHRAVPVVVPSPSRRADGGTIGAAAPDSDGSGLGCPPTTTMTTTTLPGFPPIDAIPPAADAVTGAGPRCRACSDATSRCIAIGESADTDGDAKDEAEVDEEDASATTSALTTYLDRMRRSRGEGDCATCALSAAASLVLAMSSNDNDGDAVRNFVETESRITSSHRGDEGVLDDEGAEEVWALLRAAIASSSSSAPSSTDVGRQQQPTAMSEFVKRGPDLFAALVHSIRTHCLYSLSVPHPLSVYAEKKLLKLTDDELDVALDVLSPYVDWSFRKDGKSTSSGRAEETEMTEEASSSSSFSPEAEIVRWRKAARLAQTMGTSGGAEDAEDDGGGGKDRNGTNNDVAPSPMEDLVRRYHAICPDLSSLPHSCVPRCAVVGSTDNTFPAAACRSSFGSNDNNDGNDDVGNDPVRKSMGPVTLELIALHDITAGEVLTLSRMDGGALELGLHARAEALREVMGTKKFVCGCVRCRYERCCGDNDGGVGRIVVLADEKAVDVEGRCSDVAAMTDSHNAFHWIDVKRLGDLAMQHQRYEGAADLYEKVLSVRPDDGEVLHARAASYLERGSFRTAQRLWREAAELCPDHPGVALEVRKQVAYGFYGQTADGADTSQSVARPSSCSATKCGRIPNFVTIVDRKCFVTEPDSPLITPDECLQAISWAEDASKSRPGGWTTSRHYAVPTTDLPVHEIPPLLSWFNVMLNNRLRPLLAAQFGEAEVGTDGKGVYIHDAFVVRYDATRGQRHLPLHRDQSTHSFTIALNDSADYDGGGTYVASLGRSIRPGLGGVASFRGDELLHGGDPVVRGVRYVIVAFCFVSGLDAEPSTRGDGNDVHTLKSLKRSKVDGIFNYGNVSQNGGERNGFSFGFEV